MNLFWSDKKNKKIIELLKNSKQSFDFDQEAIKLALLLKLPIKSQPEVIQPASRFGLSFAASFAAILLFLAGATLTYANSASPGDKLYFLDQFQEKVILKLPLPNQTRANVQEKIVSERILELKTLQKSKNKERLKIQAVKNSEKSLDNAVDSINAAKTILKARGRDDAVKNLEAALDRLDNLAAENEKKAEEIKSEVVEDNDKGEIETSIHQIKKARLRAKSK